MLPESHQDDLLKRNLKVSGYQGKSYASMIGCHCSEERGNTYSLLHCGLCCWVSFGFHNNFLVIAPIPRRYYCKQMAKQIIYDITMDQIGHRKWKPWLLFSVWNYSQNNHAIGNFQRVFQNFSIQEEKLFFFKNLRTSLSSSRHKKESLFPVACHLSF